MNSAASSIRETHFKTVLVSTKLNVIIHRSFVTVNNVSKSRMPCALNTLGLFICLTVEFIRYFKLRNEFVKIAIEGINA